MTAIVFTLDFFLISFNVSFRSERYMLDTTKQNYLLPNPLSETIFVFVLV